MTARHVANGQTQITASLQHEKPRDVIFGYKFELGLLGHDMREGHTPGLEAHYVCGRCQRGMRAYRLLGVDELCIHADFDDDTQCEGRQMNLHGGGSC
jgi:hypothetical protein